MLTFRFGKIYNYNEDFADDLWSYNDLLVASSYYATCKHLGYMEDLCYSLSSMYVSMSNQPELRFSSEHMNLMKQIFNRVEKA